MKDKMRIYGMEEQGQDRERDGGTGIRTELLEQLKEEEKIQRQEEYEQCVAHAVNEMSRLAAGKEWAAERDKVEKIMDTVQNMAFMEGYHYAIAVLEEGLIK